MEELEESRVKNLNVSDWLIIFLLMVIPVVNIVMLAIWATSSGTPPVKKVFAKAALIWLLIVIAAWAIFVLIFGLSIFSLLMQEPNAVLLLF